METIESFFRVTALEIQIAQVVLDVRLLQALPETLPESEGALPGRVGLVRSLGAQIEVRQPVQDFGSAGIGKILPEQKRLKVLGRRFEILGSMLQNGGAHQGLRLPGRLVEALPDD